MHVLLVSGLDPDVGNKMTAGQQEVTGNVTVKFARTDRYDVLPAKNHQRLLGGILT